MATRFVAGFLGSPAMNFLAGRLDDTGTVVVDGQRLRLPSPPQGVLPGAAVDVGIRPEDIAITEPDAGMLAMDVEFVEELGATRLIHGRTGQNSVTVQVPTTENRISGRLGLATGRASLHLFDPASGARLVM